MIRRSKTSGNERGAMLHNRWTARSTAMLVLATAATVAASGCKGADATKAATTPTGMAVGPENVAIVKAQQIRSGPAISGTLAPEEQTNVRSEIGGAVLSVSAEQGQRVAKGAVLARIDDANMREAELSARAAVTTAQNTADTTKRHVERK